MALTARFILDTSALARMRVREVRTAIGPVIELGLAATTPPLDAEALHSARGPDEYRSIRVRRSLAYHQVSVMDRHWTAAFDAQQGLAETGRHRAVGIVDLLTSVVAAEFGLTVIHYDSDFEIAAEVVDLRHRWVAPRGSLD